MEFSSGLMAASFQVNFSKASCMAKANTHGRTGAGTKARTRRTKSMATERTRTLMVKNTQVTGRTVCSMELDVLLTQMTTTVKASGSTASTNSG